MADEVPRPGVLVVHPQVGVAEDVKQLFEW
jgi:hypothetical protein